MGYDFYANNKELKPFHMSAGEWPYLLKECGSYFTCIYSGARWYMLFDERMTTHFHPEDEDRRETVINQSYPAIICNCGFEITEEETKVIARISRNYAAIQRTLDEPAEEEKIQFDTPEYLKPFPQYIRRDWVEDYGQFADWAEASQGFKIY